MKLWKVVCIAVLATACTQISEPGDNPEINQSQLDQLLAQFPMFSGSILVAQSGGITASAHAGFADKESNTLNDAQTLHSLASVGKMFTAVAIAQLVEAKLVNYGTPVTKILPELRNQLPEAVTVDNLLHHTSGLQQIADIEDATLESIENNSDYFDLVLSTGISSDGPSEFAYNNANFQILGEIIERLSGQTYESYVREHVSDPINMTGPMFVRRDRAGNLPVAQHYLAVDYETWWNSEESIVAKSVDEFVHTAPPETPSAGGGAFVTALDMIRFAHALRNGTLISVESFEGMCSLEGSESAADHGYGRGCSIDVYEQGRRVGHTGSTAGIQARFFMYLDQGWDVVVLSNHDEQAAPIFAAIDGRIRGR